jgi:hypothetical protein
LHEIERLLQLVSAAHMVNVDLGNEGKSM